MGAMALAEVRAPQRVARGHLGEGIAVMRVGDRVVMVDMNDYDRLDGAEAVIVGWEGEMTIDRPAPYSGHAFAGVRSGIGSGRRVGGFLERPGVIVLGRVVRDY